MSNLGYEPPYEVEVNEQWTNERLLKWREDRNAFVASAAGPRPQLREVDYDAVHDGLISRSGALGEPTPLPSLLHILNEMWEEDGMM
ncbi:uncharacterized protein AMSG_05840 [Thecamonas trahens ATCC 50062]|uniref:DUF4050 domain-containing protein n=1 Tax=Thecamonas trahens ATCC 50062 TaxID=461836 RepID=A0A0L0DDB9_THETB|nr:hypothetical protein AMSG_05840 [Thecamonas trahens ATCC 50062]KNC50076.1 hypothetical protein AMSG_05840 [Thecamonas trahens ATCC 50062]|eukprot:XP_013757240.1 hypothetical protein AMSG_05840 [Thecamonas trahens ATCC 50062]